MTVRMKDIAAMLGVSTSTVSRALKNDPLISLDMRNKVFEIAKKNQYTKRKSRSKNVYYLIDKDYFLLTSNFYNSLIEIIERELEKEGYRFHFSTISDLSLKSIDMEDVAGIMMTSSYIEELIVKFSASNIPIVLVDSYLPLEDISAVITDNAAGIMKAMNYLASKGHKKIGYLSGIVNEDIDCADRLSGYRRAAELFHLTFDPELIIPSELSMSAAYDAVAAFLKGTKDFPTAFIGVNDIVAIGAMHAIKDSGRRVPEDISVVGFDDIALSNEVTPRLTTIRVNKEEMGKLSVSRLVELIKGKPVSFHKIVINPSIVERDSVCERQGKCNSKRLHTNTQEINP